MPKRRVFRANGLKHHFIWVVVFVLVSVIWLSVLWNKFFHSHSAMVPSDGGIYTESIIGTINNLNPLAEDSTSFDQDLQELIFEGLVRYNPITAKIEEGLAEFRIGEDGRSYEVIIKDSAKFSDGKRVTVKDVLFTFEEVIQNPHFRNKSLNQAFEYVTLDVIDERTVKFVLPEQNVFFLSLLTIPIIPHYYFKNALIDEITDSSHPFNRKPVGAGPYRLNNVIPEGGGRYRIFLDRNPDYYGAKPHIPQVVFYLYPDVEKLKADQTESTIVSKLPPTHKEDLMERLETEYEEKIYLLPRYMGIFYNLDRDYTRLPSFRKALQYGINKDLLLSKEKGWRRIDAPFFFEGIETNYQVKDFIEARRLLRDNGFPYNRDQEIRTYGKGGDPIQLRMITSTAPSVYSRFAQQIVNTWEEELDIEIDLQILEAGEFQAALEAREYDIVLFGSDFSQNFDSLSAWHSSQSGKLNLSNLTREDVDFLIDEIRFSGAQSDFFILSQKLDELTPATIFATPEYSVLVSKDLKGFTQSFGKIRKYADRFAGVSNWYFFEEKAWDLDGKGKIGTFLRWMFGGEKDN